MFHKNFIILFPILFFIYCQASLIETLNQLSTTEKVVLSTVPLVVPAVATVVNYFSFDYEPKTQEQLVVELEKFNELNIKLNSWNIKNDKDNKYKFALKLYKDQKQINFTKTSIIDFLETCKKTEVPSALYDDLRNTINCTMTCLNMLFLSDNEATRDLIVKNIKKFLYLGESSILILINRSSGRLHQRIEKLKNPRDFLLFKRLITTYKHSCVWLRLFTGLGIALPFLYILKKSHSPKR